VIPSAHTQIKTFRRLSIALILSIALNIFLIGYVAFYQLDNWNVSLPQALRPTTLKSNSLNNKTVYVQLSNLSLEQLVSQLKDKQPIEDGLKIRDIALGILVNERAFDIQRGLGKAPSFRIVHLGIASIPLFTKLSDQQFTLLQDFGKNELWPLTPKGMFLLLKDNPQAKKSLVQAFMLTPSFQSLEKLFPKVEKTTLLNMAQEGNWDSLDNIPENFLADTRQQVLLDYIDAGSPTAAALLLQYETYFAFKRLEDEQVLKVLRLSSDKNALTIKFILSMIASPRSEEVKALAMQKLSTYTDKTAILNSLIVKAPDKKYVVQQGDNLWKIAKKSNVSLDKLLKANSLTENAVLQPGTSIVIPY
jgi:LysM repeat protein